MRSAVLSMERVEGVALANRSSPGLRTHERAPHVLCSPVRLPRSNAANNKHHDIVVFVFGAGRGSRTLISSLARTHNSRYTIPANVRRLAKERGGCKALDQKNTKQVLFPRSLDHPRSSTRSTNSTPSRVQPVYTSRIIQGRENHTHYERADQDISPTKGERRGNAHTLGAPPSCGRWSTPDTAHPDATLDASTRPTLCLRILNPRLQFCTRESAPTTAHRRCSLFV